MSTSRLKLIKNYDVEANKDPSDRGTLHTDAILLHMPPTTTTEENLGRFLHKYQRFLNGAPSRTRLQGSQTI